jgi:hypothetical protein
MRLTPDQFWTYFEWLFEHFGLLVGFLLAVILAVLGFLVGFIVSMIKYGPAEGFLQVSKVIRCRYPQDIFTTRLCHCQARCKRGDS